MINMFFLYYLFKFLYFFYFIFLMIFIFILMNLFNIHPMIVSLYLVIYTLLICLFINMMKSMFWYSYILYLIIIGGVMILFMYFTSLVMNEKSFYFKINMKLDYWLYMIMLIFLMYNFIFVKDYEMKDYMDFNFKKNLYIYIKMLYMNIYLDMNIFLMLYLLMMMIFVVFVCLNNLIPLRKLN